MKTKLNKATKVNVSAILADIKKSGDAPVSQANIKRLRHILPPEALVRGTRLKISDIQPHSFNMEISPTNRKTKPDKISKVKLNTIVAKIKKRGVAPLSAESVAKMENVPPFAWPTKGVKTLPSGNTAPRLVDTEVVTRTPKATTKSQKGSRLAAVYANILKGVPPWKVQGQPAPQYTTGNMPGHTVLASSTVKVVKRGHSKPKALEAPHGKKPSKLFTPPAKDVELGKQVKALRAGTKNKTQKG